MHTSARRLVACGLAALAALGCSQNATLRLDQDFAPPAQRSLELGSSEAYFAGDGDRQQFVSAYPLPGAKGGPRAFVLYLDLPDGTGDFSVATDGAAAGRGLLAQQVGLLRGGNPFVEGTVKVSSAPLQADRRIVSLDVRTERGARLHGKATFQRSQRDVRRLSRAVADDATALGPVSPTDDPPATEQTGDAPVPPAASDDEPRDE